MYGVFRATRWIRMETIRSVREEKKHLDNNIYNNNTHNRVTLPGPAGVKKILLFVL